ncbi:MAG: xylulokinase [Actinomycetota bacterium]|nr:xylulokinase [Actinomycetota bacterium]
MPLVAGIDSSTQSVKVVVRDADTGVRVREAQAAHPDGTEVEPRVWWEALQKALGGVLDGVEAISVAGQQHGMVVLDDQDEVIRPALLWNDTRSASDAVDLIEEFGGPAAWAQAVGSVPVASFTVAKIRWLARVEPDHAARVARLMLPHDYLTWRLAGAQGQLFTDRGDASGTGYWSPSTGEYRDDLVTQALGHLPELPRVCGPATAVATTPDGSLLGVGTGDNMAGALALDLQPGDVVVSLGTSGTAFASTAFSTADASGFVAGFADATGNFLPLVCTLNAARVLSATAQLLGADLAELGVLALAAPSGADGLCLLPYFDGERTPNLPDARGSLHGITRSNFTPENVARAAIEGMLIGMAQAVDALVDSGVQPRRILLIGGAAANPAVRQLAATVFDFPIHIPPAGQYVADGAARQAAWILQGEEQAPHWERAAGEQIEVIQAMTNAAIREQYENAQEALYALP